MFLVLFSSTAGIITSQKYSIHWATQSSPTNKSPDHFTYNEVCHCVILLTKEKKNPWNHINFFGNQNKATHVVLIATKHKIHLIIFLYIPYAHSLHYSLSLSCIHIRGLGVGENSWAHGSFTQWNSIVCGRRGNWFPQGQGCEFLSLLRRSWWMYNYQHVFEWDVH